MGAGEPFRHRLTVVPGNQRSQCTCGHSWDGIGEGLAHVRLARRWRYLGVEVHYDEQYHMWEHALTGHRYAWHMERWVKETLR